MLKMAKLVVEVNGEAVDGKGARLTLAQCPTFLPTHLPASSLAPTTTQQPSSNILRHN